MSATTPNQIILPRPVLNGILKSGLVITAGKGTGKSNAGKVWTADIIRNQPLPPIQVKIFDTASNLRWDFEPILCQEINEKTRYFYDKDEHILFDIALVDDEEVLKFMERVVMTDYLKQRKRKEELEGHNDKWILYLVEEAQNILGTHSLMRRSGRRLLKLFSEGRNFGLSFIFIGQRLADISTKAIERCNGYLFGRMNGDNDLAKLKRIVGRKSSIADKVQKLEIGKGEFMFYNGGSTYDVTFPLYKSNGNRPRMFVPNVNDVPMWRYIEGKRMNFKA